MSHGYTLICMDCRCGLFLGKIVCADERGEPLGGWYLGGRYDEFAGNPNQRMLARLERFVILHRRHELRVVPDDLLNRLRDEPDVEVRMNHLATDEEVIDQAVDPPPSMDDEGHVPAEVVERLRTWK